MNQIAQTALAGAYFVPGLPHVLQCADRNSGYQELQRAMRQVGDDIVAGGAQRIIYYSTQWIAVLDQMFQARAQLKGIHVDENWYDYGSLEFDMNTDRPFAAAMGQAVEKAGHKIRLVDYAGFPIDTGTIVADSLVNPQKLPTGVIANNVYSDFAKTRELAAHIRTAIDLDGTPTAVVVVSGLSGRYFTTDIDLREDRFGDPADDQWNRILLDHWSAGQFADADLKVPMFAKEARADMGLKAYAFVRGLMPQDCSERAKVLGYAPIYGTGGAVVKFMGRLP